MRAFSYIRVSGESQIDRDGFTRQREAINLRIPQYVITELVEYREEGESGSLMHDDRPALGNLLSDLAKNSEVKLVFVERIDRFSRKLLTQELVIAEFHKLGVRVIAAESDIDLTVLDDDPGRILIRQIFGAIAEFEKSSIVRKLRGARIRKKKETGRCEGKKPFGQHEKHPDELETLLRIISLVDVGHTFTSIALILTEENRPCRHGGVWRHDRVSKIYHRWWVKHSDNAG